MKKGKKQKSFNICFASQLLPLKVHLAAQHQTTRALNYVCEHLSFVHPYEDAC